MKKLTLTLLTIFGLTATSSAADIAANDHEMKLLWSAWKDTHSKSYSEAEELQRLDIFAQNYNKIIAHNAKNSTVTLALNKFADLTGDEFKSRYAGGHVPHHNIAVDVEPEAEDKRFLGSSNSLPASVDWRKKGAVTPPKNQKSCQGCWAFAASGSLEALHFIKTGSLLSFSEQQLLDCDKNCHGCNRGNMLNALSYTAQNGIELESGYPFIARAQTCKYSSSKAYHVNTGHIAVRSNNAQALMTAIVSQPVLVAIEAHQSIFQFYKSGVITSGCGSATDHAVLAVGYTTVNGQEAFIVKNSYGADWGENGYVYISTSNSANGGKGVCGILSYAGYPTA